MGEGVERPLDPWDRSMTWTLESPRTQKSVNASWRGRGGTRLYGDGELGTSLTSARTKDLGVPGAITI